MELFSDRSAIWLVARAARRPRDVLAPRVPTFTIGHRVSGSYVVGRLGRHRRYEIRQRAFDSVPMQLSERGASLAINDVCWERTKPARQI